MEPITAALLGGTAFAGNLFGGMSASSGGKNALNYQKGQATQSKQLQQQASQQAQQFLNPLIDLGGYAYPALLQAGLGITPEYEQFTPEMQSELDMLMGQRGELESERDLRLSSSTGSRSKQRAHASRVAEINKQLGRISELEQAQRSAQAGEQLQGMRPDFGQDYLDQYGGLNALNISEVMDEDPVFQAAQDRARQALNRQYASQGRLASSAGTENTARALGDMAYQYGSDVYNRRRGQLLDLFQGQNALGQQSYGRNLDLAKIAGGAAQSAGNQLQGSANALTGIGLNSAANIGAGMRDLGQQQGQMYQSLGMLPMNAYGAYQNMNAAQSVPMMGQYNPAYNQA